MPAERIRDFTESVIREMTRLSFQYDAINLSQGYPDFDPPLELREAVAQAVRDGNNQYTVTWGLPALRQAVARKVQQVNGIVADPDREVTITCGATEAVIASLLSNVNPGEEVVIFEPFFESYIPDCYLCGATPVFVPLDGPRFAFDPDRLRAAFGPATRAIVLNTPHNPTGRVFRREELALIAALCQEHDVIAIVDEIYEQLTYDGYRHVSIGSLPGMADRTITICGFSKSYSVTGWRLGYAVAAPALTDGLRKVHDFLTVCAPAPLQVAALTALAFPPAYYDNLRAAYTRRRGILLQGLEAAGCLAQAPEGGYFLFADVADLGFADDMAAARHLVREAGVAAVPGSSFYAGKELGRRKLRFAFCKKEETLQEAARRLMQLVPAK